MSYPVALLLTLAIEVPLVVWLAGRRRVADACCINLFSHPLAWLSVTRGLAGFWTVEAGVVLFETLAYRSVSRLAWKRSIACSVLANGATIAVALVWPES